MSTSVVWADPAVLDGHHRTGEDHVMVDANDGRGGRSRIDPADLVSAVR
jgi:hypothetical protein